MTKHIAKCSKNYFISYEALKRTPIHVYLKEHVTKTHWTCQHTACKLTTTFSPRAASCHICAVPALLSAALALEGAEGAVASVELVVEEVAPVPVLVLDLPALVGLPPVADRVAS